MKTVVKKYKSRLKTYKSAAEKSDALEKTNAKLRLDNDKLTKQLQGLLDREERTNLEAEQIAKKRE
jgi:hypothetical protein